MAEIDLFMDALVAATSRGPSVVQTFLNGPSASAKRGDKQVADIANCQISALCFPRGKTKLLASPATWN